MSYSTTRLDAHRTGVTSFPPDGEGRATVNLEVATYTWEGGHEITASAHVLVHLAGTPAELFALARKIDAEVARLVVGEGTDREALADLPWDPAEAERVDSVTLTGTVGEDGIMESLAPEAP
jgi:hypothetical protein